jgi:uncharacterized RDD family membrane protein YckC
VSGFGMPRTASDFPEAGANSLASYLERAGARSFDMLVYLAVLAGCGFVATVVDPEQAQLPIWVFAAAAAVQVVYETLAVGLAGRTLGKQLLKLRVARLVDGGRPDWTQSALRVLVPAVAWSIPQLFAASLLVFVTPLQDPLRRGIHDRAAGTVVVRAG